MKSGAGDARSFAHVEQLLSRLEQRVPGYPRELAVLSRLAAHIEKKVVALGNAVLKPYGITYPMYQVLVICLGSEADALAPGEIAEATGERPTNVTHLCAELERRGLVSRSRGEQDRRYVRIALTQSGRELLAELQPLLWDIWRRRYHGIAAGERRQLLAMLRQQYHNMAEA